MSILDEIERMTLNLNASYKLRDELKAEIDELTRYNAAILDQNNTLSTEKEHLMALMVEKEKVFAMENERLRAALTIYADHTNWVSDLDVSGQEKIFLCTAFEDGYDIARAALESGA